MKPMELIISGWGPYPSLEKIDFTGFLGGRLFLITGPTGAGKTTIFDAITFALYGEVSGRLRDKASVRSDFAGEEDATFVELSFEHRESSYRIRRSPKYPRKKKRGEGTILTQETAELSQDNKILAAGMAEVNRKIEELMGLSYEQYKQISMIAQGEFMDLLTTASAERGIILRKLFRTDKYDRISKLLTERAKELWIKRRENENRMEEAVSGIECGKNQMLSELVRAEYLSYVRILEETGSYLKEQTGEEKKLRESVAMREAEIKDLVMQMEKEKQRAELRKRKDRLEEERKILLLKQTEEEAILLEAKLWENQLLNLGAEKKKLEEMLPLCLKAETMEKEEEKAQIDLKALKEQKSTLEDSIKKLEEERTEKKGELSAYDGLEEGIGENRLLTERLERREKDVEEVCEKVEKLSNNRKKLVILKENYEKIKKQYEREEASYKNTAIGLAAVYLEAEKPCPVCGSLEHPKPAAAMEGMEGEEAAKWRESREQSRKKYDRAYEEAAVWNGKCEEAKGELKAAAVRYGIDEIEQDALKNLRKEIKAEIAGLKTEEIRLKEALLKWGKINEFLLKAETEREKLAEKISRADRDCMEAKKELGILTGKLLDIRERLPEGLENKKAVEEKLKLTQEEEQKLEKKSQEIRNAHIKLIAEMDKNSTLLEQSEKELKDLQSKEGAEATASGLAEALHKKEEEKQIAQRQRESLLVSIHKNEKALESIGKKQHVQKKLEEEYGVIKDLDNAAKGNNPARIVLEQYVLAAYFEDILQAANIRLVEMTAGRYELSKVEKVMDARTKGFLELEVTDYYTGKKRSVKTLSGGEAFSAALSLALGLSDVVQNYAGGISVDTLFIDEGFGGLDTDALEQAVNALVKISGPGRMIGIISHVSELKERVNQQIVVEKGNDGSRIRVL